MITDNNDIFNVMHLSDSFFPTGLFATSNGIEKMFFDKRITTSDELFRFIKTTLLQQIGPSDCVMLSFAYDYAKDDDYDKIIDLDRMCYCLKPIKEARDYSTRSGKQLAKCVTEMSNNKFLRWYIDSIEGSKMTGIYTISFAICCNALDVSKANALSMFLYGFVVSNVGAALRLGMIQHYEGQKIIHKLKPLLASIVNNSLSVSLSDVWQFAPQIEIFQMKHEKMDSKMFIT